MTPGSDSRSAAASAGSSSYVEEPVKPIASLPYSPRAARRASSVAASTAARISRARSSSTSPAGASSTLRVVRYSSGSPSSASRRRICWESGGWAMCRRAAARPKCRSSATATK